MATTAPDSPWLAWALHLAGRGWAVFPLTPGTKYPAWHKDKHCPGTGECSGGHLTPEQRATTDPGLIRQWWQAIPTANIGIATGPSGLLVVDCDTLKPGEQIPDTWRLRHVDTGAGVLRALAAQHSTTVTPTYAVRTARGGWHLYYTQPGGALLRGTAGRLGWKVDTRGHGGYVVGPGSTTPHGAYELVDERDPAELPGWLHQALTVRRPTTVSAPHHQAAVRMDRYVAAALAGEVDAVRRAPQGQRNRILSRSAYALGQLVGAGALDRHTAYTALTDAWHAWGDPASETKDLGPGGVIDTSLTAGQNNPRRIRGKDAA